MKLPITLAAGVALALALASAPGATAATAVKAPPDAAAPLPEGKVLLRYKFAMGDVLRYRVKHATNLRTTIDNTTQQVESHSDSVKAWKVTDVLPSGDMEFMHVVESVRMRNKTQGGAEHRYDSAVDKQPPPGFEQAGRAVGVPLLVMRIAPDGEIKSREEKMPQPPAASDMPITLQLPDHAVAVGERWSDPYEVPATRRSGANMKVQTRRLCKLRSIDDDIATIDVEYQILTPVDPYVRSQLVERLTNGTVRFDIRRGRIVDQVHNVDRRVLGFAGAASSMHFVARRQERLINPAEEPTAGKSTAAARRPAKVSDAQVKPATAAVPQP